MDCCEISSGGLSLRACHESMNKTRSRPSPPAVCGSCVPYRDVTGRPMRRFHSFSRMKKLRTDTILAPFIDVWTRPFLSFYKHLLSLTFSDSTAYPLLAVVRRLLVGRSSDIGFGEISFVIFPCAPLLIGLDSLTSNPLSRCHGRQQTDSPQQPQHSQIRAGAAGGRCNGFLDIGEKSDHVSS